mmetsp:Transcript_104580/g.165175  ORF Transcript_104580/g.165175 Transcript_104580/m.165175 type:complete len:125 (-) Transcript_104580:43-417(-)|eukprot:CAMPEP_0169091302 /NCGR_PEP_ID=MMETSP1015-20121227/16289_1 /TAXON_ID=342587 /ORGANISM="Karlodinium micrum, Strain CCMP2283" /LENGTH=124 /DNA_ID=CAMNT_0009151783 /DNA_START=183 /DNA_END=557 /DNA_ORIENTATION=-
MPTAPSATASAAPTTPAPLFSVTAELDIHSELLSRILRWIGVHLDFETNTVAASQLLHASIPQTINVNEEITDVVVGGRDEAIALLLDPCGDKPGMRSTPQHGHTLKAAMDRLAVLILLAEATN